MRAYISIAKMRFGILLQYRVAALMGACTQFFFGFVKIMVFYALYRYSDVPQPMTYAQVVTYVWLGQATLGILPWGAEPELFAMIRSGNVAYEFCRPLNLYTQWFCRSLAFRTAPTLMRGLFVFAIVPFFLPDQYAMSFPASTGAFAAWLAATGAAVILSSAITNLMNIVSLWTISGEGIVRLVPAVVNLFSGVLIPLPFFPQWMQGLVGFLPFRGLMDTPIRFYTGHLHSSEILPYLSHQLIWSITLILFSQWLLNRKMNKILVQGG